MEKKKMWNNTGTQVKKKKGKGREGKKKEGKNFDGQKIII